MILNKVKLKDFISHKDSEFDLGYGINVVVGPNGAGKTSILDAISFALFNDYSGRGKREHLINSRASRCKAAVEFTEGGIRYSAEWNIEKKKSPRGSLYRFHDGDKSLLAQGGGSAVVPEIEKILGIDRSMFMQSIYVRQGEIEELVTAKPADRKKLISRLLGLDDLEAAWNDIKSVIEGFQSSSDQLKGELAQRSTIEVDRRTHAGAVVRLDMQIQSRHIELSELDSKIGSLQVVLERLNEDKKSFERLDTQRRVAEKEIEGIEKSLADKKGELEEAIKAEEKVKSLEADVAKLQPLENYAVAVSQKREQEAQRQRLADKLGQLSRLEKTLTDNEAGHGLYLEKDRLLEEKSEERKKLEGVPSVLKKILAHQQQVQTEEQKKSSELASELSKWSGLLGQETTLANFESALNEKRNQSRLEVENQGRIINELSAKLGGFRNKLKDLEDNLSIFRGVGAEAATCPTCETELPADRIVQLVSKFTGEKESLSTELQKTDSELSHAAESKKQSDARFQSISQLDTDKISGLKKELDEKAEALTQLISEVGQLEEQAKALDALDADLEELKPEKRAVEEAFRDFESASREIRNLPSRGGIEAEMEPVVKALEAASTRVTVAISSLGYEPEQPEEELASLRAKKQEYDQNTALANRRAEFEESAKVIEQGLNDKRTSLVETNEAVKNLAYDEVVHSAKQLEFDEDTRKRNSLDKTIAGLVAQKEASEGEISNCDGKLAALKSKEKEKRAVDGFIGLLNKIRTAYGKDGVQKMIRATARPLLEKSTRDLFERFNLAYSDIKIDDDYDISVIGPSGEQSIDQISGGERVALAIALRLAIAQVLSGRVETIVMDEPTTHLDEERRKELVNILSSFFREGGRIIPQMLVITHHREIEDVADLIYTVKKENGYSVIEAGSPAETAAEPL